MKDGKFEVGDRIETIGFFNGVEAGQTGTVKELDGEKVLGICLDNSVSNHSLRLLCEPNCGLWIRDYKVNLIDEKEY